MHWLCYSLQVDEHLSALKDGGWIGEGANSFFTEMDGTVVPGMVRLAGAMDTAGDTVARASILLQEAEEDAASIFGGTGISVPIPWQPGTVLGPMETQQAPRPALYDVPPRDYGLMSDYAYKDTENTAVPEELAAKGWERLESFQTKTGYYGVALINHQTGEVVISHRGTDMDRGDFLSLVPGAGILSEYFDTGPVNPNGSDLDDDAVLAVGGVPGQFLDSRDFVSKIESQLAQRGYDHYQITHTGHSLGGFLADMHAAENEHRAITFDNPGAKESLARLHVTYDPSNHLAYQSHANLVNTANTQAGFYVRLRLNSDTHWTPLSVVAMPTLGIGAPIAGAIADTLHDHSLENMLAAFDPATGRPYRSGPLLQAM